MICIEYARMGMSKNYIMAGNRWNKDENEIRAKNNGFICQGMLNRDFAIFYFILICVLI